VFSLQRRWASGTRSRSPTDLSHRPSSLRCDSHVPNANVELSGELGKAHRNSPVGSAAINKQLGAAACQSLNAYF